MKVVVTGLARVQELLSRIPKSGDIGYGQTDYHQPGCSDCPA